MITFYRTRLLIGALTLAAANFAIGCGGASTSASPPAITGPTVSTVTLSASTIALNGAGQGTITLSATAATAVSVTLTTSNAAVATVPASVAVPAGSSTAAFTITGVAAGTATVTATLNGSSSQSPMFTVVRIAVSLISFTSASVVGGNSISGTVALTAAAPAGGAVVVLAAADPVTVPASVTVPAGSSSATFGVTTRAVNGTIVATVTGTYGGASASASLSVTKPTAATASFGVTGPTETDTCSMGNSGNTLKCTFNGSTSSAPGNIVSYQWTFQVGTTLSQTTTGPVLDSPAVTCGWLPAPPLPAGGFQWLPLTVTLIVRDDLGNVSPEAVNKGARVFPQGVCGY